MRPLLGLRRSTLHQFLRERGQSWREDSSNQNIAFLRNRVRHQLLPSIVKDFGQSAIEHMAELAEIARAEDDHWKSSHPEIEAQGDVAGDQGRRAASLPLQTLVALPLAAQRRLMRTWLETNSADLSISFHLIEEALELAAGLPGRKLELPHRSASLRQILCRKRDHLSLESEPGGSESTEGQSPMYEYELPVPGAVAIPELGISFEARVVSVNEVAERERSQLLNMERIPKEVLVRNWRPGDRYWPAHSAAAKKVKTLLSDRHATGTEKKLWPVAVKDGDELIWMRGFPVPTALRAPEEAARAIWIRETAGMM